jgi:hypothetical protein
MDGKRCRFWCWRMSLSANRIPLRRDMRYISGNRTVVDGKRRRRDQQQRNISGATANRVGSHPTCLASLRHKSARSATQAPAAISRPHLRHCHPPQCLGPPTPSRRTAVRENRFARLSLSLTSPRLRGEIVLSRMFRRSGIRFVDKDVRQKWNLRRFSVHMGSPSDPWITE